MTAGERLAAIAFEFLVSEGYHGNYIAAEQQADKFAAAVLDHLAAELGSERVREAAGLAILDQSPHPPPYTEATKRTCEGFADAALGAVRAALGVVSK